MKSSRRVFLLSSLSLASTFALVRQAVADTPKVDEKTDPTAQTLGYKSDAAKVDKAKFPQYAAGQKCANCALFRGKPGDAFGPCPIYAGKLVASGGWCSAYTKKS